MIICHPLKCIFERVEIRLNVWMLELKFKLWTVFYKVLWTLILLFDDFRVLYDASNCVHYYTVANNNCTFVYQNVVHKNAASKEGTRLVHSFTWYYFSKIFSIEQWKYSIFIFKHNWVYFEIRNMYYICLIICHHSSINCYDEYFVWSQCPI